MDSHLFWNISLLLRDRFPIRDPKQTMFGLCVFTVPFILKREGKLFERQFTSYADDLSYCFDNLMEFSSLEVKAIFKRSFAVGSVRNDAYTYIKTLFLEDKEERVDEINLMNDLARTLIPKYSPSYFGSRISEPLAAWLTENRADADGKLNACCPFNSLYSGENDLAKNCLVQGIEMSDDPIAYKTLLNLVTHRDISYVIKPLGESWLRESDSYDVGFTLPPMGLKLNVAGSQMAGESLVIQKMLSAVKGRFVVFVHTGYLFSGGAVQDFRKRITDNGRLKAVIALPARMCPYTSLNLAALLFESEDKRNDRIMMADLAALKFWDNNSAFKTDLNDAGLKQLTEVLHNECDASREISHEDIAANKYILDPGKYIISQDVEDAIAKVNQGTVRLGEIATVYRVQATRSAEEGEPFFEVSVADIDKHGFFTVPEKIVRIDDSREIKNRLKPNDIILSIKGSIGRTALIDESHPMNLTAGQSFVIIRIKDPEKWPAEFVFKQLKSREMSAYINHSSSGNIIKMLSTEDLKNLLLIEPTPERVRRYKRELEEQRSIVKQIAELREKLESLEHI